MVTKRKSEQETLFLEENLINLVPAIKFSSANQNDHGLGYNLSKARKSPEPARMPTDNTEVQLAAPDQQGGLDDLTNLPNRAQFSYHLQKATLSAQQRN